MQLPSRFTQAWIERTLPTATPEEAQTALAAMRRKGWTEEQLAKRVMPHMPERRGGPESLGFWRRAETLELPAHITKAWLDRHLPGLNAEEIEGVMHELEARGWPVLELGLAVMPHLLPKLPPEKAAAVLAGVREAGMTDGEIDLLAPGLPGFGRGAVPLGQGSTASLETSVARRGSPPVGREIELPCLRGHVNRYVCGNGDQLLSCPTCEAAKRRKEPEFHAVIDLICKGVERNAVTRQHVQMGWRRSYTRTVRIGTRYRVAYANPTPPPPQRLMSFTERGVNSLHLKSGHHFSVVLYEQRKGLFSSKTEAAVRFVVNHEIEKFWQVS